MGKKKVTVESPKLRLVGAFFDDCVRLGERIVARLQQSQKFSAVKDRPSTPEFYLNRRVLAVTPP